VHAINLIRQLGYYVPSKRRSGQARVRHEPEDDCEDCDRARRLGIWSVCTFDPDEACRIRYLRELDKAPPRWMGLGNPKDPKPLAYIESRAWLEWKRYHRRPHCESARVAYAIRCAVIERDGYVCWLCRGRVLRNDVDIDHVIPRSKGGATTLENLRVAHSSCNRSRSNRDVAELDQFRAPKLVANIKRHQARATQKQDVSHADECNVTETVTQGNV
jgi:5-methylcytosine-specific restriction endonuclease McrA